MLVFHGGLSIEQVKLLKENRYVIFEKIPKKKLFIPDKNTFDYFNPNRIFQSRDEFWESIRNDIYFNQYLFFFKYLKHALEFCHNSSKRNYILVVNIDDKILNDYIGCGRYIENQIEYRVPRSFITPEAIKDFLFFEPFDDEQMKQLKEKYPNNFFSKNESSEVSQIMYQKKLIFNEDKIFPEFNE